MGLSAVRLDEKSPAGCALASWNGQLCLAWTGTDLRLNVASSPDGRGLAGKQRINQRERDLSRWRQQFLIRQLPPACGTTCQSAMTSHDPPLLPR